MRLFSAQGQEILRNLKETRKTGKHGLLYKHDECVRGVVCGMCVVCDVCVCVWVWVMYIVLCVHVCDVADPRSGPLMARSNTCVGFNQNLSFRRNLTPRLSPLLELTHARTGL